ncbi:MFS transporter [Herbiconiux liukaitaii]|uniref:MFS transporter n=1 Tax=Herbiconiux liukaitaii TaxID=3342799 RepID=UPI0035B92EDC
MSEGPFSARFRLITIGAVVLVFVAAFENLAVTTVMPTISAELDGAELYAVAFAAPLAASVLGMVGAGLWSDRTGPSVPLVLSVVLFATGLLIAGTAVSMELVVVGRLVQGLGSGATTVALYVIVARVFPPGLQPRIFGLFAAAWVVPSLVGPFLAGVVGETIGWRWVFLGVVAIILPAAALLRPALKLLRSSSAPADATTDRAPIAWWRIVWALVLSASVLALSVSTELKGGFVYLLAAAALVVALIALRTLLPTGALRAAKGLSSVVSTRLLLAAGFFAAEVYLPYLFTDGYGLGAAAAGLALSASGITWGAVSLTQGRFADRIRPGTSLRIGSTLVVLAIAVVLLTAALHLPVGIAVAGWAISGAGMGLCYPRLSVLTLANSTPANQGFNSSALNIADASGPAMALAISGILFQGVSASAGAAGADGSAPLGFVAVFALALALAVGAFLVAPRATATRP